MPFNITPINVSNNQTWNFLFQQVNNAIDVLNTKVVSVNSNTATGNGVVNGSMQVVQLVATTLSGSVTVNGNGVVDTTYANLTVSTNAVFQANVSVSNNLIVNGTISTPNVNTSVVLTSNLTANIANISTLNYTTGTGNTLYLNSAISFGNSTVNAIGNSTQILISDTGGTSLITKNGITSSNSAGWNTVYNSNGVVISSNGGITVSLTSNTITLSNGTVNTVINNLGVNTGYGVFSNTLATTGAATFSNTVSVTGATTLSNTLATTGAITGSANLTIAGSANVSGAMNVTGATTLSSTLATTGAATFSNTVSSVGAATFSNTVSVTGATTLSSTLATTGAATFSNTVSVTGAITGSANLTLTGSANVSGGMNILGAVAVSNTFSATGPAALTNTISVTGAATLSNTLVTTGAATFSNTISVAGSASITGQISTPATIYVGNTTQNVVSNSTTLIVSNSSYSAYINDSGFVSQNSAAWYSSLTYNTLLFSSNAGLTTSLTPSQLSFNNGGANTVINNFGVNTGYGVFSNTVSVTGAITGSNTLTITGAGSFSNTLSVTGSITGSNILSVTGAISTGVSVSIGNSTVNSVANSTTFNTSSIIAGTLSLSGNASISGNVSGVNNFALTGAISVGNSTVNSVINSTAFTASSGVINQTLTVGSTSTFQGNVGISGILTTVNTVANAVSANIINANTGNITTLTFTSSNGSSITLDTSATVGNSTVNSVINSTAITASNATINKLTVNNVILNGYLTGTLYGANTTFILKANNNASAVPNTTQVAINELYINSTDRKLYSQNSSAGVVLVGSGKVSGLSDVSASAPSVGDTLNWNGSAFVSGPPNVSNVSTNITYGNSTVNAVTNSTGMGFYNPSANASMGADTLTFNRGANTITTSAVTGTILVTNTTGYFANLTNSTLTVGNSTVNAIVNSTAFSGTANNATNLGGTPYYGYQTTGGLAANVAVLTANSANYIGTLPAASVANTSSPSFSGSVSVGGNLLVNGSLTIAGSTTFVNATSITTNDLNIVLANNASTLAQIDGAGILTGPAGGYAYIKFIYTQLGWVSNYQILPSANNISLGTSTSLWNVYANNISGTLTTVSQPNITANNATYFGGSSLATVQGWITANAATAYTNAVSYVGTNPLSAANSTNGLGISGTANSANYIGTLAAASVANTSNAVISSTVYVGANVYTNTSAMYFGNSTVNAIVNSTSFSGTANNATNLGGSSLATVQGWITANAATAYSNVISQNFANSTNNKSINGSANNITAFTINQNVGSSDSPTFNNLTTSGALNSGGFTVFGRQAAASEGGRINLQAPTSGTALSGDMVIDFNGNSFRVFESDGNNRGVNLNLTGAATGAASVLLHSSNYNSYAPTLTGTGASGTWGIGISGTANAATYVPTTYNGFTSAGVIKTPTATTDWAGYPIGSSYMINITANGIPVGSSYGYFYKISNRDDGGGWGGIYVNYDSSAMYYGATQNSTSYATWNKIIDSNNYNAYAPTLTGANASGTWGISITGTANNSTYFGGSSLATVQGWITANAATAYTNAVSYVNTNSLLFANSTNGNYSSGGSAWTYYINGAGNPTSNIDSYLKSGSYYWAPSLGGALPDAGYGTILSFLNSGTVQDNASNWLVQLGVNTNGIDSYIRTKINEWDFSSWIKLINTANYNSYAPTLTGTGASGTWGISITGTANNSTNFGGSSLATVQGWITANAATAYTNAVSYVNSNSQQFANSTNGFGTSARVLLNTINVTSNTESISDTTSFTSTYKTYEIVFENLQLVGGASSIPNIQFYANGAWITTSTYYVNNTASATSIAMFDTSNQVTAGNTAVPGMTGMFRLNNPSSTTIAKFVYGRTVVGQAYNSGVYGMNYNISGMWSNTQAVTGVRINAGSTLNFSNGSVRIYGMI